MKVCKMMVSTIIVLSVTLATMSQTNIRQERIYNMDKLSILGKPSIIGRPSIRLLNKEFKMVIVSHLGEVTREVKYVGETVWFRIYIPFIPATRYGLQITNQIDQRLKVISISQGGQYSSGTRTIIWRVGGPRTFTRGRYVEFKAECTAEGSIKNTASVLIPSPFVRTRTQTLETNPASVTIYGPPRLGWVPFDRVSIPTSRPTENMKEETTTGIMINLEIPGMFVKEQKIEGITYHVLSIPGKNNKLDIGKPALPLIGQLIGVPFGVTFTTEIIESSTISLDHYNVIPARMPEPEQEYDWRKFIIDKNTYRTDAVYPKKVAEIDVEDIGVIRGHRLLFLKVNPIRYNPATRETTAYRRIEVRVKFNRTAQIRGISKRIQSQAFEQLLKSSVLNYKNPLRFYSKSVMEETQHSEKLPGCDYLIITHNDFYSSTDPTNPINELTKWKNQKGLTTRITTVSSITSETTATNIARDIREYIQNTYNNWYPVPTYVLLVGDVDRLPTNVGTDHPSHRTLPDPATGLRSPTPVGTDLYYGTVDPDPATGSSDYYPDIYIGRISADSNADVDNAINKIIDYETSPPTNANYYTSTSLVRLFEDDNDPPPPGAPATWVDPCPSNGQEDCSWILIELAEELRDFLQAKQYTAERIYDQSGNFAQGPLRWEDGSNLPDELTFAGNPGAGIPGFPWNGGVGDIMAAFNAGRFLITYRGHGMRAGWGRPNFTTWDLPFLTNAGEFPIIFGLTCQSGWFDNESDHADLATNNDCFAEEIIRLNNSGAAAVIASARNSWGVTNNSATIGMCDALWPDFDSTISSGRLPKMGQINTYSKVYMANNVGAGDARTISFEMNHLFGDPEMTVWTEEPSNLVINCPTGIGASGEQDFIVSVTDGASGDPVQSASVTITRGSSIIANRQTNAGGIARFTMQGPGAGDAEITVTALDYRPENKKLKITGGGAVINRLDPDNGIKGHTVNVGGMNFNGNENIVIYLEGNQVQTTQASNGKFGQTGIQDVSFTIPSTQKLGPVNVLAEGQGSTRYAVDVFIVRTANPIDLAIYSQWDSSTWTRFPNIDHVTWNNPDIQLYEGTTPVQSGNLSVNKKYKIRAKIVNDTSFTAQKVKVTFKWALYGAGQNSQVWTDIDTKTLDVPTGGAYAEILDWKPPSTGHVCLRVQIYHVEDIKESNNIGQENCHVGTATSPAVVPFLIYNPTKKPAMVHLELRQLIDYKEEPQMLWLTWLKHPDPQLIQPGQRAKAAAIVEPHSKVRSGEKAEFSLTAFIGDEVIGGINFIIKKK